MNKTFGQRLSGFSLVEMSVASFVMIVALSITMAGFRYSMRGASQNSVQDQLDVDVQTSMERLKYDLRVTSLNRILLYPEGPGPYTAMSFPQAVDSNGDGSLEFNGNSLVWDRAVVYHVWQSVPYELRQTVFEPWDPNLSDAQRMDQLRSVVTNGHGRFTHGGANTRTTAIFRNLFNWQITTSGSSADCYKPVSAAGEQVRFGSAILAPGSHTFRFSVIGKNASSSGRKIGIDTLFVSPSYSVREGEAQLPPTVQVGVSAQREYLPGGWWSGNYQLLFPATADGQYFELSLENDRWEETNFSTDGDSRRNARVVFDETLSPKDFVIVLEGSTTNWTAASQTASTNLPGVPMSDVQGCVVRVPIRGRNEPGGDWITAGGRRCRFLFKAGAVASFDLDAAFIAESADSFTNTMNTIAATRRAVTFGGSLGVSIPSGGSAMSDLVDLPIDSGKSYLLSYAVQKGAGHGYTMRWDMPASSGLPGCYIIPASSVPGPSEAALGIWTNRSDVITTNSIIGVECMFASYASNGVYESAVFDTQQNSPQYQTIAWNASAPSGTSLDMYVRTGNSNDMSDASSWTNLSSVSPGGINPGAKRYLQFMASLTSDSAGLYSPVLKDVTIRWAGVRQGVDVSAVMTKGPDYGIVQLTVDGQKLVSALNIELEIFKEARGFVGTKMMTSKLSTEITPRNSGR